MTVPAINRIITALDDRVAAIKTANGYSRNVNSTRKATAPHRPAQARYIQ